MQHPDKYSTGVTWNGHFDISSSPLETSSPPLSVDELSPMPANLVSRINYSKHAFKTFLKHSQFQIFCPSESISNWNSQGILTLQGLLYSYHVRARALSHFSRVSLCDPMDCCSPQGGQAGSLPLMPLGTSYHNSLYIRKQYKNP